MLKNKIAKFCLSPYYFNCIWITPHVFQFPSTDPTRRTAAQCTNLLQLARIPMFANITHWKQSLSSFSHLETCAKTEAYLVFCFFFNCCRTLNMCKVHEGPPSLLPLSVQAPCPIHYRMMRGRISYILLFCKILESCKLNPVFLSQRQIPQPLTNSVPLKSGLM